MKCTCSVKSETITHRSMLPAFLSPREQTNIRDRDLTHLIRVICSGHSFLCSVQLQQMIAYFTVWVMCTALMIMYFNPSYDQFSPVSQSYPTLCNPMDCSAPGLPVHHQLPGLAQTHVHWVSDAIQPSHPLSSPSPPAFNLSQCQGLFQWVSSLHQVAKVMSFSFNISLSNECAGLVSFRMDWLDLLAVQGTLKSLLQHHSSKASILRRSGSFIVQLSHPCMTTGKTIALTSQTFVDKVMSLLFNMLSRLVIALLPSFDSCDPAVPWVILCCSCLHTDAYWASPLGSKTFFNCWVGWSE